VQYYMLQDGAGKNAVRVPQEWCQGRFGIGSNSPANDAPVAVLRPNNSRPLMTDGREATRPSGGQCDVGAYEFDGDYIFADGAEVKL